MKVFFSCGLGAGPWADEKVKFLFRKMKDKKSFRLRTKRFFLTYPQLPLVDNLQEQAITNFERVFMMKRDNFRYVISEESHEDGNPHLHVYLEFDSVQGIYSQTKLDLVLKGIGEQSFHGNYQTVKSEHAAIQYVIKAAESFDEVCTNKDLPVYLGKYFTSVEEHLHSIVVNGGLKSAIAILYEMYPKIAVQRGSAMVKNLTLIAEYTYLKNRKDTILARGLNDFSGIPDGISNWLEDPHRTTLLLHGPSGTGKTELAKSLLSSLGMEYVLIRDLNGLKKFDPLIHRAVIFDDLDVSDRSREELIHLFDVENESDIRILYQSVQIPAFLVRIFTTNNYRAMTRNEKSLERRLDIVQVEKPLFKLLGNTEIDED